MIFEKGDEVLLSLRQNTGYKDGKFGWVQGHLEPGEGIKEAALREAREETGAVVKAEDMTMIAVVHNRVDVLILILFSAADNGQERLKIRNLNAAAVCNGLLQTNCRKTSLRRYGIM